MNDIQNINKEVEQVFGTSLYNEIESIPSIANKTSKILDFLVDTYSFFFNKEGDVEEISDTLDLLTDINDNDYELTDEILNSILRMNQLVEEDDILPEIKHNIKVILLYLVEVLQENNV